MSGVVHVMPVTPEPAHVMSAKPQPAHVMSATPKPANLMPATPGPAHIMSVKSKFPHVMSTKSKPAHVMPAKPGPSHKMAATPEPPAKMAAMPDSLYGLYALKPSRHPTVMDFFSAGSAMAPCFSGSDPWPRSSIDPQSAIASWARSPSALVCHCSTAQEMAHINLKDFIVTFGKVIKGQIFKDSQKRQPEPTADGEPEPIATHEPSQEGATELEIAPEPEPHRPSDQVREPATSHATVEVTVEREGAEESPAHCTAAEVSNYPEWPTYLDFPPTLPLLPPPIIPATSARPPLHPGSPSAHPQPTICAVGSPRVCLSPSASWLGDPSSPPPASESWTPPRPSDPAAPPRLLAPSSPPSPIGPPAPPGSFVPPAPPWSVIIPPSPQDSTPPAVPRCSAPPAPLGSSLPPAPPGSSVAPAPPPPAPPPPALPPSVGPLESAAIPPPWLLPP
ncbi:uncharacterized protein LOC131524086 [Onychostoma macrolepis]|uniref:uncharacterized protein LOC131524086 n=1 Tax=Onychostoma macrolepis TaxID=369639 RepID=UPI00272A2E90|nr:uncharacterized protein LOC131524086 [Onychostoma macrolepis]